MLPAKTKRNSRGRSKNMTKTKTLALPTECHSVQGGRTAATPVLLLSGHTDLTTSWSVIYNTLLRQAQKNARPEEVGQTNSGR